MTTSDESKKKPPKKQDLNIHNTQSRMNFEREKQYFGISPVALTDNVVQSVTDYVADALDASEVLLKDQEGLSSKGKQIEEVRPRSRIYSALLSV